ncbi:unnamed protein product [Cochlearia groenlandica]
MNQGNSRLLPRSDSPRDQFAEQFTSIPGGFMFDPSTHISSQSPVRQQIEIPSLLDEEFTPPPQVQLVPDNDLTPPEVGRTRQTRKPKKPRQINSFSSSMSIFDEGLDAIQDISGAGEPLWISKLLQKIC